MKARAEEPKVDLGLKDSIFVIDASAFVFRAYYALAPLSSKGRPSHAVSGFASMLLRLLKEHQPSGCVVVFDSKSPSFRKEIYSEYKANRTSPPPDISDQITAVREFVERAGLPSLQREGIEADDLIASFVRKFERQHPIVIVSSDKDLAQLVSDHVVMFDSFRSKVLGPAEVTEKYGVPPEKIRDFLALTGDSSDNIPGLPGVGPKTAVDILEKAGTIENLLKHPEVLSGKLQAKVLENKKILLLSQELVSLKEDLKEVGDKLPELRLPFPSALSDFLFEWDCTRLLTQFEGLLATAHPGAGDSLGSESLHSQVKAELKLAKSDSDLEFIRKNILKEKICVLDFETDSFDRQNSRAVGYSVAWNESEAWYVPITHAGALVNGKELLKDLMTQPNIEWIAHNWKFDSEVLLRESLSIPQHCHDTMIEAYLLNSERRSFSLDNLSQELLSQKKGDLKALLGDSKNFGDVPIDQAVNYAALDAHLTFLLHQKLSPDLKTDKKLFWLYEKIEMPLIFVLAQMERTGIEVDPKQLEKMSKELHLKQESVQKKIFGLAGGEFNINSPKQLQKILFEKLGLKPTKKTKTGYSTDESVLVELSLEHPLPGYLVEFRTLSKLLSTYVDVLPTLIAKDGRIHTQYHQTGTATGRLSSSEPNLQNIPVRTEEGLKIRSAFVADDGFELMSADYSQVELRLFAHLSGDQNMIKAFRSGRDIHAETAKLIFGNDEKEFRSRAKAINFGIIYGISAFGLSQQLRISRKEAAEFIDSYFEKFPGLKIYMEDCIKKAREAGFTETLFGRKRLLSDIHSKNPTLRSFAERVAVNAPVQGTAADIMKSAMIRVSREFQKKSLKSRILLQVHDELVIEVWKKEKDDVQEIVVTEMASLRESPVKELDVPLVVDSSFGSSWAEI